MNGDDRTERSSDEGRYIVLVSVHGLIRGTRLELGRDADTGGQTLYVVELLKALAAAEGVDRVDLFTRRIVDDTISDDYARREEKVVPGGRIVRVDAGPEGYIRKEELWDHLDAFADNMLEYFKENRLSPALIHGHYADAGYVGTRLSSLLGIPLVFTGHSLGRVKRRRLLASGVPRDDIEERYNMARRIDAEEETLAAANLVIASTQNEIEDQYGLYDHYQVDQMRVVPPGTDLDRFHPSDGTEERTRIAREVDRFLANPEKPMILAISRPDERKNIATLLEAYGHSEELQRLANLVIIAGNRDDVRHMDPGPSRVLVDLLLSIDRHDLYGLVAYPKHHERDEVPVLYRLAAGREGVFINPALTEPFGLTLLEAAASGLPIIATEDGGPQDIVRNCSNGVLIDPLDREAMAKALLGLLADARTRERMVLSGLDGVRKHYSWHAHAQSYLAELSPVLASSEPRPRPRLARRPMLYHDRAVFSDLDQNLLGDPESLGELVSVIRKNRQCATFGIATGRRLDSALRIMRRYGIPQPDVLITSVGTEIHYSPNMTPDTAYRRHIDHLWTPRIIRSLFEEIPGLKRQHLSEQSRFKLSYYIDTSLAPSVEELASLLRKHDQTANLFLSFGQFLDVVPIRASKGLALRWFAQHWGIPLEQILAAGGSGTDEDMMRGNTLAVVVANRHGEELSQLTDVDSIYYAKQSYAAGILEAIKYYDFYSGCRIPQAS